jgi:hypothetical protein
MEIGLNCRVHGRALLSATLLLFLASSPGAPQACEDELPAVPEPVLENCGRINVLCQQRNRRATEEWQARSRSFADKYDVDAVLEEELHATEFGMRGCRGTVVVPVVQSANATWVELQIVAPSGTRILHSRYNVGGATAHGEPLRLPETGYYTLRLVSRGSAQNLERCANLTCSRKEQFVGYPRTLSLAFGGSAGALPLLLGETAEGTVAAGSPLSRRIMLDPGMSGRLSITAADAAVLRVQLERAAGGSAYDNRGVQHLVLAEAEDMGGSYILTISAEQPQPAGVRIRLDEYQVEMRQLVIGGEGQATFGDLPGGFSLQGSVDQELARALVQTWRFEATAAGRRDLTVIPSGRAGLAVSVSVYDGRTGETIVEGHRVNARTVVPLQLPAAGVFVVEVVPIAVGTSTAEPVYTLQLR